MVGFGDIPHTPGPKPEDRSDLQGRCAAGGRQSRDLVAGLLGLEGLEERFPVKAAAWVDHAIEALVEPEPGIQVVFRIERRTADSEGMVVTRHLTLYYRGADLSEELFRIVERNARQRLSEYTLEALAEAFASDPEINDPSQPVPPGVDQGVKAKALLDTWGATDSFADFFAGGEIARAQLDSLNPGAFFSFVQHSDCECLYVNPQMSGPAVWFVNYPWDNRIRQGVAGMKQKELAEVLTEGMVTTDLGEDDVIMGNNEKLDMVLERAHELHRITGKTVFFSNTCTPVVIGEDVESRIKRFKEATGCPFLYLTVTPRSMVNVFQDVLVTRRLEAEKRVAHPRERTVNLVGFPSTPDVRELVELLEILEIDLNIMLLPDLTFELVDALPEGALNVFLPNQLWQHLYDQLTFSSKIPALTPAAPYGLESTASWLFAISSHFGVDEDKEQRLLAHMRPYRRKIALIREKARSHRLGFVIRSNETHFLTRPASTWGVPLLEMLESLGFNLEVYIKVEDRQDARKAAFAVHRVLKDPTRHLIKAFQAMDGMLKRIKESRCDAFLSSHFFDWRVTMNGKNLFSLQHFEMGHEGAVRTAERILGICRTPFYRRYQRYLNRTTAGLRCSPSHPDGARQKAETASDGEEGRH